MTLQSGVLKLRALVTTSKSLTGMYCSKGQSIRPASLGRQTSAIGEGAGVRTFIVSGKAAAVDNWMKSASAITGRDYSGSDWIRWRFGSMDSRMGGWPGRCSVTAC